MQLNKNHVFGKQQFFREKRKRKRRRVLHPAGKINQYIPPRVRVTPPSFAWTWMPSTYIYKRYKILWLNIDTDEGKQNEKMQLRITKSPFKKKVNCSRRSPSKE